MLSARAEERRRSGATTPSVECVTASPGPERLQDGQGAHSLYGTREQAAAGGARPPGPPPGAGPTSEGADVAETTVDVHQHLWPPMLIEALRSVPRARRDRSPWLDGWTLYLPGEPSYNAPAREHY